FPRAATMVCSFRCLLPRVCTRGTTTPGEGTRTRCRTPSQISLGEMKSPGTEVQVRSEKHHPERLTVLARRRRSNPSTEASRGEGCYRQVRWSRSCRHVVSRGGVDEHSPPVRCARARAERLVRAVPATHPAR